MANTPEHLHTAQEHGPHVRISRLDHRFASGLKAVEDVNIDVAPQELVVIVGPSGCGKTTILNIVAGLLPVQTGQVTVMGSPPMAGRKDTAYMFAQDALLPWRTVLENVVVGVEIRAGRASIDGPMKERARTILGNVGLRGFEHAYPRQLSHGMRQRVALARTFMMDSPLLLMDEPFGALDAHTKLVLEQELLKLWEQNRRTVLFITHDLAEAIFLADRILVCSARPGHIVSEIRVPFKRPRDLNALQQCEEYHHLYQQIWADLSKEMVKSA
jgi:NitT/TauT family transport system ATP-binding protein